MLMNRRTFFGLLAAPAIIKVAGIMPIKAFVPDAEPVSFYPWGASDFTAEMWKKFRDDGYRAGQFANGELWVVAPRGGLILN